MSLSTIRDRIGVIEIGLKSAQSAGGLILGMLSVVGAIGRAGLRTKVKLFRPGPRGPKVLRHQMVR